MRRGCAGHRRTVRRTRGWPPSGLDSDSECRRSGGCTPMCPGVPHLPTPAPLASQSMHGARTTLRARPPAGVISAPSAAPLPRAAARRWSTATQWIAVPPPRCAAPRAAPQHVDDLTNVDDLTLPWLPRPCRALPLAMVGSTASRWIPRLAGHPGFLGRNAPELGCSTPSRRGS